jgi:hypothetical protein
MQFSEILVIKILIQKSWNLFWHYLDHDQPIEKVWAKLDEV